MKHKFLTGYKEDFLNDIKGMKLVKGVDGVNTPQTGNTVFIDRDATTIVILKYQNFAPMVPVYTWYKVDISNKEKCLNKGGFQLAKIEGKMILVHRVMANTWLPAPVNNETEVGFYDGCKNHNDAANLYWVSRSMNENNHWNKAKKLKKAQKALDEYLEDF